ncbi:ATPase [Myxococcota bacterium]|nr:ATPase [Myxococcota bacterium]MBU1495605.1 ATPase [Myxococcota bacterium]
MSTDNNETNEHLRRRRKPENPDARKTLVGMAMADIEELSAEIIELNENETEIPAIVQGKTPAARLVPVTKPRRESEPAFLPYSPTNILSTGLTSSYIEELCLKHLFQGGGLRGNDLVSRIGLSPVIIEEVMEKLRRNKMVEITGSTGAGIGRSNMVWHLTNLGHDYISRILDRDMYIGPAPVPIKYYLQAVNAQTIRSNALRKDDLEPHFTDLVLRPSVFDAIGPAMNSGKALFFYGPPGNGKTAICERMTACFGGDIFIPFSVLVDDFVIKIFDENLHQPVSLSSDPNEPVLDRRWVKCRRPMVVVGGELEMSDMDLNYSEQVKYYEAPIQLKANNGMLLIDDFGRQRISPKELLNRWIVPLESEVDYLAMHTGKKLEVPFDVFVVFSTNLNPKDLVDDAFLRRVRYKLEVIRPDEGLFMEILRKECLKQRIPWSPDMVDYLVEYHYKRVKRPFNACEPRDLMSQVVDLSNYRGHEPVLQKEIIDKVVTNYFIKF